MTRLHASCIAIDDLGILLRGPSGAGKSDLALRLIDGGARLVADDQVLLRESKGEVFARAPENLAGLLEVRGLGIVRLPHTAEARLALVADLVPAEEVERMPEPAQTEIAGSALPLCRLDPWQGSAPSKLRLALHAVRNDILLKDREAP